MSRPNRRIDHIGDQDGVIQWTICGYRIEEIATPLTKQVRYLDKLVDELAKGRKMEKILRTPSAETGG